MNLLNYYDNELFFNNYYRYKSPCVFDPSLKFEELCHLNSNSKENLSIISKKFYINKKISQDIIDLPLINVVPGSKQWNGTDKIKHKVGTYEDIKFLNKDIVNSAIIVIVNKVIPKISNKDLLFIVANLTKKLSNLLDNYTYLNMVENYKLIHKEYKEQILL